LKFFQLTGILASMSTAAKPRAKSAPKGKLTYRGVVLQKPAAPPRIALARIKRAVEVAIAKNATTVGTDK